MEIHEIIGGKTMYVLNGMSILVKDGSPDLVHEKAIKELYRGEFGDKVRLEKEIKTPVGNYKVIF